MEIRVQGINILEGVDFVRKLLISEFDVHEDFAYKIANDEIKKHLEQLDDGCYLVFERPYVDKVYRNSYYHYYSSKLKKYNRDCIRISIFQSGVTKEDLLLKDRIIELKDKYRGFIILRPTVPKIIGRSLISPKALKINDIQVCSSKIESSVRGIKMSVKGFPHSSQDSETITCAETTLWAVMEYFSSKYPEYKPIFPSEIVETLKRVSNERQWPSKGLYIEHISYALKEFGFGSKVYSKLKFKDDFPRLLSCYVESGIPIIVTLSNRSTKGTIGHAVLCIGHKEVSNEIIENLPRNFNLRKDVNELIQSKGISFYDWDDAEKEFVFMDDNCAPYKLAKLNKPCIHYNSKEWQECEIEYFIVPLYPKIYLEAYEAKNLAINILLSGSFSKLNKSEVLIRFYLTSSRSFKDKVTLNEGFESIYIEIDGNKIGVKNIIINTPMPKFIWVAELTTRELAKERKVNGLIILDATEADVRYGKPLILGMIGGKYLKPKKYIDKLPDIDLISQPFIMYENNLQKL